MYLPAHSEETDPEAIADLIATFPLATIVAQTDDGLIANPVPLLRVSDELLVGHVAKANPMHEVMRDGQAVMAIFNGADSYISPNWYPSKAIDHSQVPTWNYETVQMHGTIAFQHDEKAKRAVVGRLTKAFEGRTNGARAWKMSDAPADYMASNLAGIVAFEISVTRVLAKSKFGQNKAIDDFANVTREMEARDQPRLAQRMADKFDGLSEG